ncbi:mucin-2-like [Marmota marmota marmota]|uniref:mucin-2-like n=1 Tax=Marmota marmota marmota TaxID=9994 RepID=UPI0020928F6C|nr:mucin-2-like [Marmota marmota marmota]
MPADLCQQQHPLLPPRAGPAPLGKFCKVCPRHPPQSPARLSWSQSQGLAQGVRRKAPSGRRMGWECPAPPEHRCGHLLALAASLLLTCGPGLTQTTANKSIADTRNEATSSPSLQSWDPNNLANTRRTTSLFIKTVLPPGNTGQHRTTSKDSKTSHHVPTPETNAQLTETGLVPVTNTTERLKNSPETKLTQRSAPTPRDSKEPHMSGASTVTTKTSAKTPSSGADTKTRTSAGAPLSKGRDAETTVPTGSRTHSHTPTTHLGNMSSHMPSFERSSTGEERKTTGDFEKGLATKASSAPADSTPGRSTSSSPRSTAKGEGTMWSHTNAEYVTTTISHRRATATRVTELPQGTVTNTSSAPPDTAQTSVETAESQPECPPPPSARPQPTTTSSAIKNIFTVTEEHQTSEEASPSTTTPGPSSTKSALSGKLKHTKSSLGTSEVESSNPPTFLNTGAPSTLSAGSRVSVHTNTQRGNMHTLRTNYLPITSQHPRNEAWEETSRKITMATHTAPTRHGSTDAAETTDYSTKPKPQVHSLASPRSTTASETTEHQEVTTRSQTHSPSPKTPQRSTSSHHPEPETTTPVTAGSPAGTPKWPKTSTSGVLPSAKQSTPSSPGSTVHEEDTLESRTNKQAITSPFPTSTANGTVISNDTQGIGPEPTSAPPHTALSSQDTTRSPPESYSSPSAPSQPTMATNALMNHSTTKHTLPHSQRHTPPTSSSGILSPKSNLSGTQSRPAGSQGTSHSDSSPPPIPLHTGTPRSSTTSSSTSVFTSTLPGTTQAWRTGSPPITSPHTRTTAQDHDSLATSQAAPSPHTTHVSTNTVVTPAGTNTPGNQAHSSASPHSLHSQETTAQWTVSPGPQIYPHSHSTLLGSTSSHTPLSPRNPPLQESSPAESKKVTLVSASKTPEASSRGESTPPWPGTAAPMFLTTEDDVPTFPNTVPQAVSQAVSTGTGSRTIMQEVSKDLTPNTSSAPPQSAITGWETTRSQPQPLPSPSVGSQPTMTTTESKILSTVTNSLAPSEKATTSSRTSGPVPPESTLSENPRHPVSSLGTSPVGSSRPITPINTGSPRTSSPEPRFSDLTNPQPGIMQTSRTSSPPITSLHVRTTTQAQKTLDTNLTTHSPPTSQDSTEDAVTSEVTTSGPQEQSPASTGSHPSLKSPTQWEFSTGSQMPSRSTNTPLRSISSHPPTPDRTSPMMTSRPQGPPKVPQTSVSWAHPASNPEGSTPSSTGSTVHEGGTPESSTNTQSLTSPLPTWTGSGTLISNDTQGIGPEPTSAPPHTALSSQDTTRSPPESFSSPSAPSQPTMATNALKNHSTTKHTLPHSQRDTPPTSSSGTLSPKSNLSGTQSRPAGSQGTSHSDSSPPPIPLHTGTPRSSTTSSSTSVFTSTLPGTTQAWRTGSPPITSPHTRTTAQDHDSLDISRASPSPHTTHVSMNTAVTPAGTTTLGTQAHSSASPHSLPAQETAAQWTVSPGPQIFPHSHSTLLGSTSSHTPLSPRNPPLQESSPAESKKVTLVSASKTPEASSRGESTPPWPGTAAPMFLTTEDDVPTFPNTDPQAVSQAVSTGTGSRTIMQEVSKDLTPNTSSAPPQSAITGWETTSEDGISPLSGSPEASTAYPPGSPTPIFLTTGNHDHTFSNTGTQPVSQAVSTGTGKDFNLTKDASEEVFHSPSNN